MSSYKKKNEAFQNLHTYCGGIEKVIKTLKKQNEALLKRLNSLATEKPAESEVNNDQLSLYQELIQEMKDKNALLIEKNEFLQGQLAERKEKPTYAQLLKNQQQSQKPETSS